MKITKRQLRRIIKEEKARILSEGPKDLTVVAGPNLLEAAQGFAQSMYYDSPGGLPPGGFIIPQQGLKLTARLAYDGTITVELK